MSFRAEELIAAGKRERMSDEARARVVGAAVAVARGWCDSPVTVHLPGGDLIVTLADGRAALLGPAERICRIKNVDVIFVPTVIRLASSPI